MKKTDFDKWLNEELPDDESEKFTELIMDNLQEFQLKEQFKQRLKARRVWRTYFKNGFISLCVLAVLAFISLKFAQKPAQTPVSNNPISKISEIAPPQSNDVSYPFSTANKVLKSEKDNNNEFQNFDKSLISQQKTRDSKSQNDFSTTLKIDENDPKIEKLPALDTHFTKTTYVDLPLISPKKNDNNHNAPKNDLKNPVSFVDLSKQRLTDIPPNIFRFEQLQTLLLPNNQLSSLSSAIGNLANLEILNLSKNKLKAIPKEVGKLKKLTSLDLSRNQLIELPQNIGDLQSLNHLNLSNNKLTILSTEINLLSQLNRLDLSHNKLKTLPLSGQEWTQLKWLNIRDNKVKALPQDIGNVANLTYLDISINALTALVPTIGKLQSLDTLNASRNKLITLPAEIGNLTHLTTLDLHHNALYKLPLEIGNLINLTSLDLSTNLLSELPKEFKKLVNLKTLDLRFNHFSKEEIDKIESWLPDCTIDY